jgi:predicted NAD/FAD-dependent oxidoreductase
MLLSAMLGWLEHEQRDVIAFLREENRTLKAQLAEHRLPDARLWRLAVPRSAAPTLALLDVATLCATSRCEPERPAVLAEIR